MVIHVLEESWNRESGLFLGSYHFLLGGGFFGVVKGGGDHNFSGSKRGDQNFHTVWKHFILNQGTYTLKFI